MYSFFLYFKDEEEFENKGQRRRTWDDEIVLKRQFSALIPAFDPRPGRTNVNQTQDFEIPAPGTSDAPVSGEKVIPVQPKLELYLKGPGLPGVCAIQKIDVDSVYYLNYWCYDMLYLMLYKMKTIVIV